MTKKHFIALADALRPVINGYVETGVKDDSGEPIVKRHIDGEELVNVLCDFMHSQNSEFMRGRWVDYLNGRCGKNGGKVKQTA